MTIISGDQVRKWSLGTVPKGGHLGEWLTKPCSSGETPPQFLGCGTVSEQCSPSADEQVEVWRWHLRASPPLIERGLGLGPQSGTRHCGLWGKPQGSSLASQGLSLGAGLAQPNEPATEELPPAHTEGMWTGFEPTLFQKETMRKHHQQVKCPCREGFLSFFSC